MVMKQMKLDIGQLTHDKLVKNKNKRLILIER